MATAGPSIVPDQPEPSVNAGAFYRELAELAERSDTIVLSWQNVLAQHLKNVVAYKTGIVELLYRLPIH
jgi:hypothetical protein